MNSPTEIARAIGQASREIAERRHREKIADQRSSVLNKIIEVTKENTSGQTDRDRHPPGTELELRWQFPCLMEEVLDELHRFGFSIFVNRNHHTVQWTAVVPCEEEN